MTLPRPRALLALIAAMFVVVASTPFGVRAQDSTPVATPEPPAFLLEPVGQDDSFFTVEAEPGSSQELTVAFGNASSAPVAALTYVANGYTLVNGGLGVGNPEDPPTGPTSWIDYPAETIDLEPGVRMERTFTVTVPDDAQPGQYISAVAIQTAESVAVGESDMLRQIIKKSIAVFIIVPGPETPGLEIGEARVEQTSTSNSLVIDVRNTGNVYLNPSGTITMTTGAGEQVLTTPVTMGPVYAGDETTIELFIPTILAAGAYTVSVDLTDESTGVSAEIQDVTLAVAEPPSDVAAVEPVTISAVTLDPITGGGDELQALNVTVSLENPEQAIPSGQLTMHVSRDGELVEDYPLNSSLVVQSGTTEIQQRYVPLGAWEPGTYTFALTLEAVDPNSGQVTVLATLDVEETIEVP